ncbi:MAG: leucine--tRNA ligase [Patescibacteria group bacterium]|nr:leucine--tRNA ligase [Patescibacteria group bacterium]|tara:strand:- start:41 stop:3010 length:2970 start_codon:yes stop_codon:yes gene_type:complete
MSNYDHKAIEKKWQNRWEKEATFEVGNDAKKSKKKYILDMLPYTSAAGLHVGHPEGYTATDIYSRYLRMNGYDVLHPMGWDAFGLPTENYAIKSGVHPKESTKQNIETFKRQIKSFGFSYDWSREVDTSSPEYYKWTQWIFLQLYKAGLAYKAEAPVNWCNDCKTVLANEQVINGKCERCGHDVIQKNLEQWFFKITGNSPSDENLEADRSYPERLLSNLEELDWPEPIKHMQRNWIGKSEGAELEFEVASKTLKDVNFVLLHGYTGSPNGVFHPWLKQELEKQGYKVQVPKLPNSDNPVVMDQVEYVLKNVQFDENTILLGHSLGSVVALKVVEALNHPIKKLVLGAGFMEAKFNDKERPFKKTFDWKFNFKKIKNNIQSYVYLRAENDSAVPTNQAAKLKQELGGSIIDFTAVDDHITGKKEPVVLEHLTPSIKVFTTRPDTLYGATYMVLAPEHELVQELKSDIQNWDKVEKYIKETSGKSQLERTDFAKEKTGVELKGVQAINPGSGEKIPVWVADYVLTGYGTGAVMAVPAHDERDFEFAKKFDLPIQQVIDAGEDLPSVGVGKMMNSDEFDGQDSEQAKWKITEKVKGKRTIQYKLRDWLISRQRYWGAPIPIIYCEKCGEVPVPEKDLPVELPDDVDFRPKGKSPLARSKSFHKVKCPECKAPARRESDTIDTFVDSSWYFLRYIDPNNTKKFASKKNLKTWLPVDTYVGGAEHAVLHLMYARFFTMALHDLGILDFEEPFTQLRNQGFILGPDGQKMSKSKGNVINPDEVIENLGADTMRMYEMFMGPLEDTKPWDTNGIIGVRRFLERVWGLGKLVQPKYLNQEQEIQIARKLAKTIQKTEQDIKEFGFNTAVSQFMIFVNAVYKVERISTDHLEDFLKILNPFAPHITNELWEKLGHKDMVEKESWPEVDVLLLSQDSTNYVVQVNGKVRANISMDPSASEDEVSKAAQKDESAVKHIKAKKIIKQIFVEGRLINFVVK